jgi:hypothetical protein
MVNIIGLEGGAGGVFKDVYESPGETKQNHKKKSRQNGRYIDI